MFVKYKKGCQFVNFCSVCQKYIQFIRRHPLQESPNSLILQSIDIKVLTYLTCQHNGKLLKVYWKLLFTPSVFTNPPPPPRNKKERIKQRERENSLLPLVMCYWHHNSTLPHPPSPPSESSIQSSSYISLNNAFFSNNQ